MYSPEIAQFGAGYEVDARVLATEVGAGGKILPHPDVGKVIVARVAEKPRTYDALEARALLLLGEGGGAELVKDVLEGHGRQVFKRVKFVAMNSE